MTQIPYGDADYWENRYQGDLEQFEWYHRFQEFEEELGDVLKAFKQILVVGAGNSCKKFKSDMSQDLYFRGMKQLYNIDISKSLVETMNAQYQNIRYQQMDVRKMSYDSSSFDVVMDKACLDCLFCGEFAIKNVNTALGEIYRVLKQNGIYVMISGSPPKYRLEYLQKYNWKVEVQEIEKLYMRHVVKIKEPDFPKTYFMYICRK